MSGLKALITNNFSKGDSLDSQGSGKGAVWASGVSKNFLNELTFFKKSSLIPEKFYYNSYIP